jgi:hypothetical protein
MALICGIITMLLSTVTTLTVYAQQQQQQSNSFVTQSGSEGSESGQFMGHNDIVPSPDGRYVFVPDS